MKQENEHITQFNQLKKGLSLSLDIIPGDEILTISLDGYLDSMNTDDFKVVVQSIIRDVSFQKIIFNCTNLSYISSTGIGVFVLISTGSSETRGKFFFLGMSSPVRQVFETLGFMGYLKTIESIEVLTGSGQGKPATNPKS